MDETGMPCNGRSGYLWVAVGVKDGNAVGAHMVATDSRRASVLDQHFSYVPRVGVTDGYPGYEKFFGRNRQRCWTHIIREADTQSEKTDSPEVCDAGRRLREQLHHAKGLGRRREPGSATGWWQGRASWPPHTGRKDAAAMPQSLTTPRSFSTRSHCILGWIPPTT